MNDAEVALATALTSIVFPVPVLSASAEHETLVADPAVHIAKHLEADRYRSSYRAPSTLSACSLGRLIGS